MVLLMDFYQFCDYMEVRCCRFIKSLIDFGLGLLLIVVLGMDLGIEQVEMNLYNCDVVEQVGWWNRG